MQNNHYDFVCRVIAELGLDKHIPVGMNFDEGAEHFRRKVDSANERFSALLTSRLEMVKEGNDAERWELYLEHMEVAEIMERIIYNGYRRCRLLGVSDQGSLDRLREQTMQAKLKLVLAPYVQINGQRNGDQP